MLQSALLETPIIGMDGSFFGLVRSVMGRHPSVYGTALRSAWHRAIARVARHSE